MFTGTGIFIASVILTSIIALCFFKKRFWENRYLVLLISGSVALVVTLTTNFATRGKLDTKVETIWQKQIQAVAFNDSLVDQSFFTKDKELKLAQHLVGDDTTLTSVYSHHLFYYYGSDDLRIGYVSENDDQYVYWKDVYIAPSKSDTLAYMVKMKQLYNPDPNYWVAGFSLPRVRTVKCLYLPPAEYAAIPDSLIRKLPF